MEILLNKTRKISRETVSYNRTTGAFFLVNIRISQPSNQALPSVNNTVLGFTNPNDNPKRMHQLLCIVKGVCILSNPDRF